MESDYRRASVNCLGLDSQGRSVESSGFGSTRLATRAATYKAHFSVASLDALLVRGLLVRGASRARPTCARRARRAAGAVSVATAARRRCSTAAHTAMCRCRSAGSARNGRLECEYHGWHSMRRRVPQGPRTRGKRRSRAPRRGLRVREQDGSDLGLPGARRRTRRGAVPRSGFDGLSRHASCAYGRSRGHAARDARERARRAAHRVLASRSVSWRKAERDPRARAAFAGLGRGRVPGRAAAEGIVGRLLSPSGGTVEHWDRFFLPSVAQVEYKLGTETHFLVTALCTPVTDFLTRLYGVAVLQDAFPEPSVRPCSSRSRSRSSARTR